MIDYTLDKENSVLHVRATGRLRKDDFDTLAEAVDPFIEQTGGLRGLVLETPSFPGWENLGAVARHFRFVRNHHRRISKVAVVTDSPLGDAAEHIASHFVAAKIKHFSAGQVEEAKTWIGSE
jgi:SpoIIAA-like